jgi:hypothetical protein
MLDIKSKVDEKIRQIKSHAVNDGTKTAVQERKAKDYSSLMKKEMTALCVKRKLAKSGNKEQQIERLKKSDAAIEAREKRKAEYIGLNDLLREELRIAFEDLEAVDQRIEDLREFRSHMSRHVSEERYAANELRTLSDNVASVICDYKMKILACYFRESQSKWFGKSGTSAIGFMIITNPTDEEGKASGKKDVSFVILFTDDTYQDEWGVATAKLYLYKNCLPSQIDTVYFTSDGAGYFKSKLHKAIMPFWKMWTGVAERKNRVRLPPAMGKLLSMGCLGN